MFRASLFFKMGKEGGKQCKNPQMLCSILCFAALHTFQRDSLTDGEEKKVAASQLSASSSHARDHEATTVDVDVAESNDIETGGGNPEDIQQMDDDENQSLGDEENLQQRFVATGNNSTSDNEVVALVSTTAAAAAAEKPVVANSRSMDG